MNHRANQRLLKQLEAPPPQIKQPASYTFSVLLSLFVALLLSLIYLCVTIGVLWLSLMLIIGAFGSLFDGSVFFAGIKLIGGLFMLAIFISLTKPFGLAFSSGQDYLVLSREEEPFLYEYVNRICETLDTPKPMEIRVDLTPNATAGPASFLGGFLYQNLVLTLGLPLALGLNIQQFSGVIAHELGHFSQSGGGTDLSHILRMVNAALARIALDEDWFDRMLDAPGPQRTLLTPLRFCNYVTRRFFYLLMLAGHASSSFETRQKEFDADAYETYLAGHEAFRHCSRNIELLGMGYQSAMNDLEEAWQDRRLMDNLPALSIANTTRMPKHRQEQLYRLSLTRKTQWHDSHPSHAERLSASHQLGYQGIVTDQRPARELFQGLHRICRQATVQMLEDRLGKEFTEAKLVPAGQFLREHEETQKAYRSLRHFYLGKFLIWRPLFPFPVAAKAPKDPRETLETIEQRRNAMALHAERAADALEELDSVDNRLILARQAMSVVELGYRINPADFDLKGGHRDHIDYVIRDLRRTKERIEESLREYDLHARWRLTHALQLMHIKRTYNRLEEGTRDKDRKDAVGFIKLCPLLQETQKKFNELRATLQVVTPLIPCVDPKNPDHRLIQNITIQCRQSAKQLNDALEPLTKVAYPFDHAQGHISIAKAIAERTPDPENVIDVVATSRMIFERFDSLLARVLARLARIAEKVETALEFPKLKQPKERDEIEEFVRKCEEEAKKPKGFDDIAIALSRWALQIGITLGLSLVLVVGMWLFAVVAGIGSGGDEGGGRAVAAGGDPGSSRIGTGTPSVRTQGNGNSAQPQQREEEARIDEYLRGSDGTPRHDQPPPAAAGDRDNPVRILHGGYKITLPNGFRLANSGVTRLGERWVVRYRWEHESDSRRWLSVVLDCGPTYVTSKPRISTEPRIDYPSPVFRIDNTYYVRGNEVRNERMRNFQFRTSRYQWEGQEGILYLAYGYDRVIEIRTEHPAHIRDDIRDAWLAVRSFERPADNPARIDAP